MDEAAFRRLITETKERARDLSGRAGVSAEVKSLIIDFQSVTDNFDRVMNSRVDTSGDQRMLQKRFDVLKQEHSDLKKRLERVNETLMSELAPILKAISTEAASVDSYGEKTADSGLRQSASNIKSALKKFVETLKKL